MIVLDTNVVSEMMKPEPNEAVRRWLDRQAAETVFLSSITVSELLFGVGALEAGRRKQALAAMLQQVFALFAGRVLPFDAHAARHHADLVLQARRSGRGCAVPDSYIAAIAVSRGYAVATRDTGGFPGDGLVVIDPWSAV